MGIIRRRLDYILKHNLLIQRFYKYILSNTFKFIGIFIKTDDRLILFNGHGRKFNDSPKKIYDYLIKNGLYKDYKIVWALDEPEKYDIPFATKVKMDTLKYFIIALKAKYWVSCVNIERGLKFKKKQTIYLNTWHGIPIKKIGNAVNNRRDFDFSNIDIFCCSGDYEREIYIRDFNVLEEKLIFSGLPRNDQLYNVSIKDIERYKKKLNLPLDKKVILYAPTWRDSKNFGKTYNLAPPVDIEYLQSKLQDKYVLLMRTHPYTNKLMGINFNNFIRDFSEYPNINELLIVADILVSDYSATIFDFSILERPIICFAYDYDEYSRERGLYLDLENEFPGGIIKTQEDLVERIITLDYEIESIKIAEFKRKYIQTNGNATEICVNELLSANNINK